MFKDIIDELKMVLKGKTLDTILPPILFVLFYSFFSLTIALWVSLVSGGFVFMWRLISKNTVSYAFFGLLGVLIAFLFAFISGNATSYYLPSIITSAFLIVIMFGSILLRRPLALWLSHLTRAFPLNWYKRHDILPAYQEVTIGWLVLLLLRFFILLGLFLDGDLMRYALFNIILGFPVTLLVLILTYVYGLWRLNQLKGPSVDEYKRQVPPPWQSQKKGF